VINRHAGLAMRAASALVLTLSAATMNATALAADNAAGTPAPPMCNPMDPQSLATQSCVNYQMSLFYLSMNSLLAGMSQSPSANAWYAGAGKTMLADVEADIARKLGQAEAWERCKGSSDPSCDAIKQQVTPLAKQMAFSQLVADTVVNAGVLINRLKDDSDMLRTMYPTGATEAIRAALQGIGMEIGKMNYSMGVMSNTMGRMGNIMPW